MAMQSDSGRCKMQCLWTALARLALQAEMTHSPLEMLQAALPAQLLCDEVERRRHLASDISILVGCQGHQRRMQICSISAHAEISIVAPLSFIQAAQNVRRV